MGKKVSGKEAMVRVLAKHSGGPMAAKDLIAAALKIATDMKGKTPAATLSAMLATENKKKNGKFIRAKPGTYKLRAEAKAEPKPKPRLAQRRPKASAKKRTGAKNP